MKKDDDDNEKENSWREKMLHDPETASKVSHEVIRPSTPEFSSFDYLKKGYESASRFIKGLFHNKEGNSAANEEKIITDEEQSGEIKCDAKDNAKEQGETLIIESSGSKDNEAQTYAKSSVKLRNKCSFEPFSIISMIFLSILISTVGAGRIKRVNGNEILQGKPTWAN